MKSTTQLRYATLPFSADFIRKNKLHLTEEEESLRGSSMTLQMLDGEMNVKLPLSMAVCFDGAKAIGASFIATVVPKEEWLLCHFVEEERQGLLHGWSNSYVKGEYRERGIGTKLVNMSFKRFRNEFPQVHDVIVYRTLRSKLKEHPGLTPVFANVKVPTFIQKVHHNYSVVATKLG